MPTFCCMCFKHVSGAHAFPLGADTEEFLARRCGLSRLPVILDLARALTPPWQACTLCNIFVQRKRRRRDAGGPVVTPMVKLLRFVVSGGATSKPDNRSMQACLRALCHEFPSNPLLQLFGSKLQHSVQRLHSASKRLELVPRLFWEHNGHPTFFADHNTARNIRRHLKTSTLVRQEDTCRHCSPTEHSSSYATQMTLEHSLEAQLTAVEKRHGLLSYITCYCSNCAQISVLSYAHDCAQTAGSKMPSADAYYTHQIHLAVNIAQLLDF